MVCCIIIIMSYRWLTVGSLWAYSRSPVFIIQCTCINKDPIISQVYCRAWWSHKPIWLPTKRFENYLDGHLCFIMFSSCLFLAQLLSCKLKLSWCNDQSSGIPLSIHKLCVDKSILLELKVHMWSIDTFLGLALTHKQIWSQRSTLWII